MYGIVSFFITDVREHLNLEIGMHVTPTRTVFLYRVRTYAWNPAADRGESDLQGCDTVPPGHDLSPKSRPLKKKEKKITPGTVV